MGKQHGKSRQVEVIESAHAEVAAPLVMGFGVVKCDTGWLTVKGPVHIDSAEVLNPLRHGEIHGEKKETAVARLMEAIRGEYRGRRVPVR